MPLGISDRNSTTLNKITPRRFQQHLQKRPLCSGIMLHRFLFTYSPAFAKPQAKPTKKIFESLQCKNAQISSSWKTLADDRSRWRASLSFGYSLSATSYAEKMEKRPAHHRQRRDGP